MGTSWLKLCLAIGLIGFAHLSIDPAQAAASQTVVSGQTEEISRRVAALEIEQSIRMNKQRAEEIQRQKDDLIAQDSMAQSTQFIAKITFAQLVIGIITAFGLAISIAFTWTSIGQTRTLIKSNQIYSEHQLRAYLDKSDVEICDFAEGQSAMLKAVFKNYGSTPAVNLRAWIHKEDTTGFPESVDISLPGAITFIEMGDIAPGASGHAFFGISSALTTAEMARFTSRKKSICYVIIIIYDDVFGKTHVFQVSSIRSGKELGTSRMNLGFNSLTHRDIPTEK